jgi:hypothetical protein
MAKLTNVRERIHQPFRDTLIRTSGLFVSNIQDRTDLFTIAGKSDGETNLKQGSVLPSDQSMVVLALRVFLWFRNPIQRGPLVTEFVDPNTGASVPLQVPYPQANGDFQYGGLGSTLNQAQALITNGNAPGDIHDVYRLYWQAEEQLLWSFGAGDKFSMTSMPSAYFPYGGGLFGDIGGATDLIYFDNGTPDHTGILRLARAILIPPRQNIKCQVQIVQLPDGGNAATFFATQGARNMLSLKDNLNVADLVNKVVGFTFDGLFSRDVQ